MEFDMVFEGGGAKGAAFVGALRELEARGHTGRRYIGTSAGAITATLRAAGFTADDLYAAVTERLPDGKSVFTSFMDVPADISAADRDKSFFATWLRRIDLPLVPDAIEDRVDAALLKKMFEVRVFRQIFSLVEKGGLYEGEAFLKWITARLDAKKPGLGSATLAEFATRTGADLSLIASDTTGEKMLVLNHRTAPKCPVAWAVRMSMSIPFVWQEVSWKPAWGTYMGEDITGHTIVDGGVLSNFPMHLISTNLAEVVAIMGDTDPFAVPNLGMLIDETLKVPNDHADKQSALSALLGELKPVKRLERLIETMLNGRDRMLIESCLKNNEICRLPAQGYGATEFDISGERLQALIDAGQKAAREYFERQK